MLEAETVRPWQDIERIFGVRQLQETLECDLDIRTEELPLSDPYVGRPLVVRSTPLGVPLPHPPARAPSDGMPTTRVPHLIPSVVGDPSAPTAAGVLLFVLLTEPTTCHSCHYASSEPSLCCPAGMNLPPGQQRVSSLDLLSTAS